MRILQGCLLGLEDLVCKILKSLYDLKQAGRFWNKMITKFFRKIGFIPTNTDVYILTIQWKEKLIIVGGYIKELVLGLRSLEALKWLKNKLMREFNINDFREVKKIIG